MRWLTDRSTRFGTTGVQPQNFSGLACCTCGSARTLASTSAGSSPSISISAMALPPGASRPTWKVAMLMPASPSVEEKRADEARLVEIGDVDHRGAELGVHADALDVDDARPAVGEHRAGHRARLALGRHRHRDQALVVALGLARHLLDHDAALLRDDRRRDDVDVLQHRPQQAGDAPPRSAPWCSSAPPCPRRRAAPC